jgi:hypothetical protein
MYSAPTERPATIEGMDPVLAYPIAPPREVSSERAMAEFVGRGLVLCFFFQVVVSLALLGECVEGG